MSVMKDGRYPIELGGKTRHLLFSLNALDEVQDRFGGYDKLEQIFNQDNPGWIKDFKWLLTMLINEGAEEGEEEVTEKQLGKWIHTGNMAEVQRAIIKSFSLGTSGGEQEEEPGGNNDGIDEGNAESGQVS